MVLHLAAGGGQFQPPTNTFKQHQAELFFERRSLTAQRRLGQAKRSGRRSERSFFSGRQEGAHPVPVKRSIHAKNHRYYEKIVNYIHKRMNVASAQSVFSTKR